MAAYDLEEQERIDALKDWWEKWRTLIYVGVAAFLLGIAGLQGWKYYQAKQQQEAEVLFKSVEKTAQEVAASKEYKKLSEAATAMAGQYPKSFQATDAQLLAAKSAFDAGDLAAARTHLQWIVDNGRDSYKQIARVRLAAVLLDEKKFEDALKLLDSVKDEGFVAMAADLRGDVFAAQGKKDEARAAYQLAVEKSGDRGALKSVSQAKLDAFGGSPTAAPSGNDSKGSK